MYWLNIVVWDFGAWKTFYTHGLITWHSTNHTIRIGNYTSPDFHIEFRSVQDLVHLLTAIYNFKKDPENLKQEIVLVLDEASLYFNSRDFRSFPKEMLAFMVQLRKLNVHMYAIVQSLKMLDTNFRRLAFFVTNYSHALGIVRIGTTYELLSEDANINEESNVLEIDRTFYISPRIKVFIRKQLIAMFPSIEIWLWSHKYDTNELVLPHLSVMDEPRANKLFPYTHIIETADEYLIVLKQKRAQMTYSKHTKVMNHFEWISWLKIQ